MQDDKSKIVLVKDSEWSMIDGQPCRIIDFIPLGSGVDKDGKILSTNKMLPYASIIIECEKLGKKVSVYITHKVDFQHLWKVFKERMLKENEEVIIIWTRKQYKRRIFKLLATFMPKLRVMVFPKGAFELIVNPESKPELSDEARLKAMRPIIDWKPEVMK